MFEERDCFTAMRSRNPHRNRCFADRHETDSMRDVNFAAGKFREQFARDPFDLALGHRLVSLVMQPGDFRAALLAPDDAEKIYDGPAVVARDRR